MTWVMAQEEGKQAWFIMLPGQEEEPGGFWELLFLLLKVLRFPVALT